MQAGMLPLASLITPAVDAFCQACTKLRLFSGGGIEKIGSDGCPR